MTNQIKALEKQIKSVAGRDKVDLHLTLAEMYIYNDVRKSHDYAILALEASNQLNYSEGTVCANIWMGNCARLQNRYEDSQTHFNKALTLSKQINRADLIAKTYQGLGGLNVNQKKHRQGIINFKKAHDY